MPHFPTSGPCARFWCFRSLSCVARSSAAEDVGVSFPLADFEVDCDLGDFVPGAFTIEMHRDWAPIGYDRFMELVKEDFFTDQLIYRTIPGFLVQFGVHGDPAVQGKWNGKRLQDDKAVRGLGFDKGLVSFAGNGKNSRSTHIFIADMPNGRTLGKAAHERPFGKIVDNVDVLDSFHDHGYGDVTSLQSKLVRFGNSAADDYPKLPRLTKCEVILKEQHEKLLGAKAEL